MHKLAQMVYLFALSLAVTSCMTARHGDAIVQDNHPSFPLDVFDELKLPKIPLGKKAVYSYKVLDLPTEIYPQNFELDIPDDEAHPWVHGQPWKNCIIEASLLTLDGEVFFSKRINFADGWYFQFTDYDSYKDKSSLPSHLSYIFRVNIIRPSLRGTDELKVETYTMLRAPKTDH